MAAVGDANGANADLAGGGVDHLRKELEAIIAGSARDTADRVALICAARAQAALEEERWGKRSKGLLGSSSVPTLMLPLQETKEIVADVARNTADRVALLCAARAQATLEEELRALRLKDSSPDNGGPLLGHAAAAVSERRGQAARVEAGAYDCAAILRSAMDIKDQVHMALSSRHANGASSIGLASATSGCLPGEALRNSVCNVRNVAKLAGQIFKRNPQAAATETAPAPPSRQRPSSVSSSRPRAPVLPVATHALTSRPALLLPPREAPPPPKVMRPQAGTGVTTTSDVEKHRAANEDLIRVLAELTADLRRHHIVGAPATDSPRHLQADSSGQSQPENYNIGD